MNNIKAMIAFCIVKVTTVQSIDDKKNLAHKLTLTGIKCKTTFINENKLKVHQIKMKF